MSQPGWAGGAGGIPPPGAIPASKMNPNMKPGMRPFTTNNGQTGYYQIPMPTPWGGAGAPPGGAPQSPGPMPISNPYGGMPQMGGGGGPPQMQYPGMGGMMAGMPQMGPPQMGNPGGPPPMGKGGMYR